MSEQGNIRGLISVVHLLNRITAVHREVIDPHPANDYKRSLHPFLPSLSMTLAAAESSTYLLEAQQAEPLSPLDFPETYDDLRIVLSILGNGAYERQRLTLMDQPDDTFERVKRSELILLLSLAEFAPEDELTEEHRQEVRYLFLLMGVPGAQEGSVTHRLRTEVHGVRVQLGV